MSSNPKTGADQSSVVFHLFHGLRGGGAAQHSGSPQAMLWNVPGLEIVIPPFVVARLNTGTGQTAAFRAAARVRT